MRVDEDWHGRNADERREQRGLAFHDWQTRDDADVAEPQHRGAVRDDRDGVLPIRVQVGLAGSSRIARQTRATPGV
jgi:hypothetical protein